MISNVAYRGLDLNKDFGLVVTVQVEAPPGAARSSNSTIRREFFESNSRLPYGGLAAVITKKGDGIVEVDLAIVTTCASYPLRGDG